MRSANDVGKLQCMKPSRRKDFRSLVGLAAAGLLAGCTGASSEPVDTDGDELLDQFEAYIGTDPAEADSDGDGFTDGEEYLNYFDPDDILAYPLRPINEAYCCAVNADREIQTGTIFDSHTDYWTDNSFTVPVARQLGELLRLL